MSEKAHDKNAAGLHEVIEAIRASAGSAPAADAIMKDLAHLGISFVTISADGVTRLDPQEVFVAPPRKDEP